MDGQKVHGIANRTNKVYGSIDIEGYIWARALRYVQEAMPLWVSDQLLGTHATAAQAGLGILYRRRNGLAIILWLATHVCTHTYTHMHTLTCTHTRTHIRTHTHTRALTHAHTHAHTHSQGELEMWNKAEASLSDALNAVGRPWTINEGSTHVLMCMFLDWCGDWVWSPGRRPWTNYDGSICVCACVCICVCVCVCVCVRERERERERVYVCAFPGSCGTQ